MRVSANSKLIQRRGRLGVIASFAGMAILFLGLFASFRPQMVWVSFVALLVGFLLAQIGTYNISRWGRSPRPDQVIEEMMKGFDDRYQFYVWTLPAPYVLLTPQGIYSFTSRLQRGQISVTGSQWKSKRTALDVFTVFARDSLGNPSDEARTQAARVQDWLRNQLPHVAATVQPVVIFLDPRVALTISEPTVPVVEGKNLKKWLRGGGKGEALQPEDFKAVTELFEAAAAQVR